METTAHPVETTTRRRWRRWSIVGGLVLGGGLFLFVGVQTNLFCKWIPYCLYESPGFRFTVVDKETGQPLADVHALAEWVMYGFHGTNGPLMVQDATSGADGLLTFVAWGPIRGASGGLVINHDPVITLFKPGYRTLLITNRTPGPHEKTRVRMFGPDGQTIALEPFRGTPKEWLEELRNAIYPARLGGTSESQLLLFRESYLNRKRIVRAELEKLPKDWRDVEHLIWSVDQGIKFLMGTGS